MKNVIVVIAVSLFPFGVYSQIEKPVAERKSDSVSVAKALTDLVSFNLSENDKGKVSAAVKKANQIRKEALKRYWKEPSFQKEFDRAGLYQDSVLLQILGKDRFMKFKAQAMKKRDLFESAQRSRWQLQQRDSTNRDTNLNSGAKVQ